MKGWRENATPPYGKQEWLSCIPCEFGGGETISRGHRDIIILAHGNREKGEKCH